MRVFFGGGTVRDVITGGIVISERYTAGIVGFKGRNLTIHFYLGETLLKRRCQLVLFLRGRVLGPYLPDLF